MFNLCAIYSARKSSNHKLSKNHKSVLTQTHKNINNKNKQKLTALGKVIFKELGSGLL